MSQKTTNEVDADSVQSNDWMCSIRWHKHHAIYSESWQCIHPQPQWPWTIIVQSWL